MEESLNAHCCQETTLELLWTIEQWAKTREKSSNSISTHIDVDYQSQVCLCLLCVLDSRLCNQ